MLLEARTTASATSGIHRVRQTLDCSLDLSLPQTALSWAVNRPSVKAWVTPRGFKQRYPCSGCAAAKALSSFWNSLPFPAAPGMAETESWPSHLPAFHLSCECCCEVKTITAFKPKGQLIPRSLSSPHHFRVISVRKSAFAMNLKGKELRGAQFPRQVSRADQFNKPAGLR